MYIYIRQSDDCSISVWPLHWSTLVFILDTIRSLIMSSFGRCSWSVRDETHYCSGRSMLQFKDVPDNRLLSSLFALLSCHPFVPSVPKLECVYNTRLTYRPALLGNVTRQRDFLGNARRQVALKVGWLRSLERPQNAPSSVNPGWMAWNVQLDFQRSVSRALENQGKHSIVHWALTRGGHF